MPIYRSRGFVAHTSLPPNSESPLATVFPHRPDRSRRRVSPAYPVSHVVVCLHTVEIMIGSGAGSGLTMDDDNSCHPIYIYISCLDDLLNRITRTSVRRISLVACFFHIISNLEILSRRFRDSIYVGV